jgi:hypothetical protein
MPRRNDTAGAEVRPDTRARSLIRIRRQQARAVVWVCVFEEFADDGAFVEGFGVVLERRDEATWVES